MVRRPLTPEDHDRGRRLAAAMREARGARSLVDVAQAAGISAETLRKIESGRIPTPAFFTVVAVADALGISLAELAARSVDGVDAPQSTRRVLPVHREPIDVTSLAIPAEGTPR